MFKSWVFLPTKILAFFILSPFFRLQVEGKENLPQNTGFVLLAKHQRWEDIPLIGMATGSPLYYVAKYELFKIPPVGWFLKALGGIPLNRKRPIESRKSLQIMMELLGKGQGIVVFPEGTYFKNVVGPGKVGIVKLVQSKFHLPFVPLGIKYRKKNLRTHVQMRFGQAIWPMPNESAGNFLDRVMSEISRLSELPRLGLKSN